MQYFLNFAVVESKRQVRWFHETDFENTDTLRGFARVQSTHIFFYRCSTKGRNLRRLNC